MSSHPALENNAPKETKHELAQDAAFISVYHQIQADQRADHGRLTATQKDQIRAEETRYEKEGLLPKVALDALHTMANEGPHLAEKQSSSGASKDVMTPKERTL